MLRRVLAVAFATASLALVPGAASATPEQASVDNYLSTQYSGSATVLLADGRTAQISLLENQAPGMEGAAYLSVTTYREAPCQWGSGTCPYDFASGFVPLGNEQIDIDPNLGGASVTDASVTIVRYAYENGTYTRVEETVTISVVLTGTGPVSRSAVHGTECPVGDVCQNVRVEASRDAVSEVTFGGETVTGTGGLFRGVSINAAAPKIDYDGGSGY